MYNKYSLFRRFKGLGLRKIFIMFVRLKLNLKRKEFRFIIVNNINGINKKIDVFTLSVLKNLNKIGIEKVMTIFAYNNRGYQYLVIDIKYSDININKKLINLLYLFMKSDLNKIRYKLANNDSFIGILAQ